MKDLRPLLGKTEPFECSCSSLAYNFVKCSSLSRVYEHIGSGLFIVSASRGEFAGGPPPDQRLGRIKAGGLRSLSKENFDRYRALQADLIHEHMGYITAIGKYWETDEAGERHQVEELSLIVPYRNTNQARHTATPEMFEDFAMSLAEKYDQYSYLYVAPGQETDNPIAEIVETGLHGGSRGNRVPLDAAHIVNPLDDYLTLLYRSNKNARGAGGKAIKFGTSDTVAASRSEIGIRGPNPAWAGQIPAAQLEILYL